MGHEHFLGFRYDYAASCLRHKVGQKDFPAYALDQVTDYALDLKNFHQTSHACWIAPVLIATRAPTRSWM